MNAQEQRRYVEGSRLPLNGSPYQEHGLPSERCVEMQRLSLAHALLVLTEDTVAYTDEPDDVRRVLEDRWPGATGWLGDPTDKQIGWATGIVRKIKGA